MANKDHQQELIITLRKLTIRDYEFENKRISFELYDGKVTHFSAHHKVVKNSSVRFFGQSFRVSVKPDLLFFIVRYEVLKDQWRQLVQIKVSQEQISKFSNKKNVYISQQNSIRIVWQAQIVQDTQIEHSATFCLGKRNLQDFSDDEIYLSPKKTKNRQHIYSPGNCRQIKNIKNSFRLCHQDTLSQRKSDSLKNISFNLNTDDTLLVNKSFKVFQQNSKIFDQLQQQRTRIYISPQKKHEKAVKADHIIESMQNSIKVKHEIPVVNTETKCTNLHRFCFIASKIDLKHTLQAILLGAVSGFTGALLSTL